MQESLRTLSMLVTAAAAVLALVYAYHQLAVPDAPTNLRGKFTEDHRVELCWEHERALVFGVRGFHILRRFDHLDTAGMFSRLGNTGPEDRSFSASCPRSSGCVYRVVAVSPGGVESSWSNYRKCDKLEPGRDRWPAATGTVCTYENEPLEIFECGDSPKSLMRGLYDRILAR